MANLWVSFVLRQFERTQVPERVTVAIGQRLRTALRTKQRFGRSYDICSSRPATRWIEPSLLTGLTGPSCDVVEVNGSPTVETIATRRISLIVRKCEIFIEALFIEPPNSVVGCRWGCIVFTHRSSSLLLGGRRFGDRRWHWQRDVHCDNWFIVKVAKIFSLWP